MSRAMHAARGERHQQEGRCVKIRSA